MTGALQEVGGIYRLPDAAQGTGRPARLRGWDSSLLNQQAGPFYPGPGLTGVTSGVLFNNGNQPLITVRGHRGTYEGVTSPLVVVDGFSL